MRRGRPKHDDILTPREWQVLDLIRQGLTNEQIASSLAISESGARYHVSEILSKLSVASREEAAAWADKDRRRRGLLSLAFGLLAGKAPALKAGIAAAGVAGVAGLGLLFFLALGQESRVDVSPGPLGKIAYIQDGGVWVKALPEGTPYRLAKDGNFVGPRWSPSGEWLLYVNQIPSVSGFGAPRLEVWVAKANGSSRRRIDTETFTAFWSPVADQLVYWDRTGAIVIEDADGGGRREVIRPYASETEDGSIGGVAWSRDGQWLVYVDERQAQAPAGSPKPADSRTYVGVWRIGIGSGDATELFNLGDSPTERVWNLTACGGYLLFSLVPLHSEGVENLQRLPLRAVSGEGRAPRDLGVGPLLSLPPACSPDWDKVALTTGDALNGWTDKSITLAYLSSGQATELTGPGVAAISPAWSPDGRSMAYVASPDSGSPPAHAPLAARRAAQDSALATRRIWIMASDGSDQRQLTRAEGFRDETPQWSNDGAHILLARLPAQPCPSWYSLWLLTVQDGSLTQVAADLPLFGTHEALEIGDIPRCNSHDGPITDMFGYLNLAALLDWWQAPASR